MGNKVYQKLALLAVARQNCVKSNNAEWQDKHEESIEKIINQYLPSGSGIDSGVKLDLENSNDQKLVFNSSFHAMDENGYYDRWIDFTLTVKPSLSFGFTQDIKGKFGKYQDIKEYLYDTFRESLDQLINN